MFRRNVETTRHKLSDIDKNALSLEELKNKYEVLVIDDKDFINIGTLAANGFRVKQWRDVEDVTLTVKYPIIACDVNGVGNVLRPGSPNGGLHVLHEIKKHYPDKYLIQYSTVRQDFDENLIAADRIYPKDTSINTWQRDIEKALTVLGNPKLRWIRLRRKLSDDGMDAYDIYKLEQAYIKELLTSEDGQIQEEAKLLNLTPEASKLIAQFITTIAVMGFKEIIAG